MISLIKRYRLFLALLLINIFLIIFFRDIGIKTVGIAKSNLLDMLSVLPPIFILIGLLDSWVKRETMVKYMGKGSGIVGILLGFFIGSAAAGPLNGHFPVAEDNIKKGRQL